jgi:succinate-semialdehyde dehydrogenase/glutarate-semialdehyde dehydrogenase
MTQTAGSNGSGATPETVGAGAARTIRVLSPCDGALVGEAPILDAAEVRAVVARARRAQQAWALADVRERGRRLVRFRQGLVEHAEELADLLAREAGKPRHEALMHEVAIACDLITYFAKEGARLLAPEERRPHLFRYRRTVVDYFPRGVVGVIGPWNFPLQLPLRDVVAAVVAGNAAVVKPSEVTPLVMLKAKQIWDESGMPEDLLGVVTGLGDTGAALIDAGIDLCVFTGSVGTGRRVAAACGERLIPCIMELGGKAPLIACGDSDVERTAQAIVNGGFVNSGQVCISVERVYAHRDVHEALVDRVVELTRKLRAGNPAEELCDVGAVTFARQLEVAERHIADALANGAVLRCGGKRIAGTRQGFEPTVLDRCTEDCTVMREEIFGPIVPFMPVASEEEALALANDSHLGLNAYVFTDDAVRGQRLAERIEAGCVIVNDVLVNGGIAEAPFGGVKTSGFGRVMGPEGLRAMCHTRHLCLERVRMPKRNPLGFPYTSRSYGWLGKALRAMYGASGVIDRLRQLF